MGGVPTPSPGGEVVGGPPPLSGKRACPTPNSPVRCDIFGYNPGSIGHGNTVIYFSFGFVPPGKLQFACLAILTTAPLIGVIGGETLVVGGGVMFRFFAFPALQVPRPNDLVLKCSSPPLF